MSLSSIMKEGIKKALKIEDYEEEMLAQCEIISQCDVTDILGNIKTNALDTGYS